jgi:hypothetical protein
MSWSDWTELLFVFLIVAIFFVEERCFAGTAINYSGDNRSIIIDHQRSFISVAASSLKYASKTRISSLTTS